MGLLEKVSQVDLPWLQSLLASQVVDFITCLQVVAALALTTTFCRVILDQKLPWVFLFLPVSLVCMPLLFKWSRTRSLFDGTTRCTLVGVISGVACGFLSSVVHVNSMHTLYMSRNMDEMHLLEVLGALEVLHIPVLIGSLLHSFQSVFRRFPSPTAILTAASTAFFGDLFLTTCYGILGLEKGDDLPYMEMLKLFILIYMFFFLFTLIPLFRDAQRAWLTYAFVLFGVLYWQTSHLGTATWKLNMFRFPVPGYLLGVVYAFHGAPTPTLFQGRGKKDSSLSYSQYSIWIDHSEDFPVPLGDMRTKLPSSLLWFSACFMVERISLLVLYAAPQGTDCVISCTVTVIFILLMSSYLDISMTVRVLAVSELIILYLCWTMVSGTLINNCYMDIVLGLLLVSLVNNKGL